MMFIIPHDAFLDFPYTSPRPSPHPLLSDPQNPFISAPILTRLNTA